MRTLSKKILFYILRILSELVLRKYKPKIVVITGSVGKTSTKDAVYAVFSKVAHVRKSEKSYNSEIGLPLTILGCPNGWNNPITWAKNILSGLWLFLYPHKYPRWLVLEVGVGKPGDMKRTASWLRTDVVIITAIPETPAHIEFFNSREHLIEEKGELINTLKKGGLLVLNADEEAVYEMRNKTSNEVITYGFGEKADIRGSDLSIDSNRKKVPEGIVFRVDSGGASLPVEIDGVFGKNHVYAALAALAVMSGLKFNMLQAIDALKNYDVPPGRMRLLSGINGSLLIDDTYNSSPFACEAALKTLGEIKSSRKVAVLGDMLELGKHTIEAHKQIGVVASQNSDFLIVVGPRAKSIKEAAEEEGMKRDNVFDFANSQEAGEFMKNFVGKGDLVLIKGSQGMRMERVVEKLLLDQENKHNLLVRQDEEWLLKS